MMTDKRRLEKQLDANKFMVKRLLEFEDDLTSWEREFLESIGGKVAAGFILTEKQQDCLDRIFEKW